MKVIGAIQATTGTPNRIAGIGCLTANEKVVDGAIAIDYSLLITSPTIISFSPRSLALRKFNSVLEKLERYDPARALALSKTSPRTSFAI